MKKNFEQAKSDAKKVFFKNRNFLYAKDFLYDFLQDNLIAIDYKEKSDAGRYGSFSDYAKVYHADDIFELIKANYDGKRGCIQRLSKIFDKWFEAFYYTMKNNGFPADDLWRYFFGQYIED